MKGKKVLVVGGTGFIGYHLLKLCLLKKIDVTCISYKKNNKKSYLKNVTYLKCDVSKKEELKKIKKIYDIIVNLSGYIDHKNKKNANTHFLSCKNLLNHFKNSRAKIFIQVGSSSEYGKIKSPHKEKNYGKPKTIYGLSKKKASDFLFDNFKNKKEFLPFVILRFYQVFGPNQNEERLIPMVIKSSLQNKEFDCSDGKQSRDFLYVDDAVKAIFKCFNNKKVNFKIINVASGKSVKVKNLIKIIVKMIKKGKPNFGKIKLRTDEPLISKPVISNAKKFLNWKPKYDLKNALKKTIIFYKKKSNVR